ncbi:MAG: PepSY-associated TM helix domain-containing protein [Acidobacteriota bacterium]
MNFRALPWITRLQDLHYDLLSGRTGRTISGVAAACLIGMFASGLVLWWPGVQRWRRSLRVDLRGNWKRINWDLHSVAGFWLFALLMIWAISGFEFAFPQPFRRAMNAVSPLTITRAPQSLPSKSQPNGTVFDAPALVAKARTLAPGTKPGRVVMASGDRGAVLVLMARVDHGDFDTSDEVSLYFDQYTGDLL